MADDNEKINWDGREDDDVVEDPEHPSGAHSYKVAQTEPEWLLNPPKLDKDEVAEKRGKLHGTSMGISDDGYERVEITVDQDE